jgi:hypothetical protein
VIRHTSRASDCCAFLYSEALTIPGESVDQPSREETEEILKKWKKIVQALLERKPILKPLYRNERYEWNPKSERYVLIHDYDSSWRIMATRPLVDLIEMHGRLDKQCQAPAVEGRKGQICGNWFVAERPNQDHCTRTCRSRASSRTKREKDRKVRRKPK